MTTDHFIVNEEDDFQASNFPQVVKELAEIKERVKPLRLVDNEIFIVAYLKNHKTRQELAQSQPRLMAILSAKDACPHLEDLFASCRENKRFGESLENYVIDQLNK